MTHPQLSPESLKACLMGDPKHIETHKVFQPIPDEVEVEIIRYADGANSWESTEWGFQVTAIGGDFDFSDSLCDGYDSSVGAIDGAIERIQWAEGVRMRKDNSSK